jgi:MFS family permease
MFYNKFGIKSRNIELIFISRFLFGMIFFMPILALYFQESLFTVTNVAIIFAVKSVASAVFEMPTGAIADLFGRKRTLVLAGVLMLVAIFFLYIGNNMFLFILFALVGALSHSLATGTDSALIYDTLQEEKKERYFKKVIGTFGALWPLGASVGSIIGGYLAAISLESTVFWSFVPVVLGLICLLFIKEPKYHKEEHRNVVKQVWNSVKFIFGSKQLIILCLAGFVFWGFGESAHQLKPLFFEFKEIPIIYFGYAFAGVFISSSLGHYFSHYFSERFGNKFILMIGVLGFPIFQFLGTLSEKYVALGFIVMTGIFFGLRNPIIDHLMHVEVPSNKRATVISVGVFMAHLGIGVIAPLMGYITDLYNINVAYVFSAVGMLLVPMMFIFLEGKN